MSADSMTRARILEAALTGIEKYGLQALTTRKIAEEAGVNIAGINYYFRSKDALLAEALGMAIQHMQEDLDEMLSKPETPFGQTLRETLTYMLEGGQRYPGIFQAHIYAPIIEKRYDTPAVVAIRSVAERLEALALHAVAEPAQDATRTALLAALDTIMFTILAEPFFPVPADLVERLACMVERAREYHQ
jgi:AcrR family transcriptional regulator